MFLHNKMNDIRMKISGWGNYPLKKTVLYTPRNKNELQLLLANGQCIARGNGRAYGDSAINNYKTISMKKFNCFLEFDSKNGHLTVEAGVIVADILDHFINKGWFMPVTPGTKYVSIGGMVAADVHGKNHHKFGSFGQHILWIDIIDNNQKIIRCSRKKNKKIFLNTIGGMGLTGIILNVCFKLIPIETAWIKQKVLHTKNLEHVISLFQEYHDATYSVAWIDCLSERNKLGRSLIIFGEHAKLNELPDKIKKNPFHLKQRRKIKIPFNFPRFCLNWIIIKLFNFIYYNLGKFKAKEMLVDIENFFYPLDTILYWNKIYGKDGFLQFQCVIPTKNSRKAITEIFTMMKTFGSSSFLAVLKKLGKENGQISFPMEGFTLALDFPASKKNLKMMKKLDDIVLKYNGRFYLAKDARMDAQTLFKSDKRFSIFKSMRKNKKLYNKFNSIQSLRLRI